MELVYLWVKDDINKRNHAKLTQDILKQFELTGN